MSKSVRIVVADDHPISRNGLILTIQVNPEILIVGEAENGIAALELVEKERPDIIILDVDMPEMDGIEVARILKARSCDTRVIFLTMHKDALILQSLSKLGVRGYVLKDSAIEEIVECITAVELGNTFLSPSLNDLLFQSSVDAKSSASLNAIALLTKTEKNVLKLVSHSLSNREIAESLFITVRTVETHRYNICSKLGVGGTNALLKFAIQNKDRVIALTRD